jgi:hypothetical protein
MFNEVIGKLNILQILRLAGSAMASFISLPDNPRPENKGAYLVLRQRASGLVLLANLIGDFSYSERAIKCYGFAHEKGERLGNRPEDLSSWQSRNPDEEKWGGAVVAGNFLLSLSGLPELGDEAVMLVTAFLVGWSDETEIRQIATISSNPFLDPLFKKSTERWASRFAD